MPLAMAPAFATKRAMVAFCCLVGLLLALPTILRCFDIPAHEDRYVTVPITSGSYSFLQEQVFTEKSDVDLAFLGDSFLLTGVNTPAVERELSAHLGRKARVITLGWSGRGDDLMFYVLRDLLKHRRVRAVALRVSYREGRGLGRGPHPQAYRWLTACEHDPVQPLLPWSARLTAYALEAIGGMRNSLSLLRPNLVSTSPFERNLGAMLWDVGPNHGPFVRFQPAVEAVPSSQLVAALGTGLLLRASDEIPSPYQQGYVDAIRDLLQSHAVSVALIRTPLLAERRDSTMAVDAAWTRTFPAETRVVGLSPARLYSQLTDDQVAQLYFDPGHLNRNGAEYYTATIMPALLELASNVEN